LSCELRDLNGQGDESYIGHVDVEALLGVDVCEQTGVDELPAEDCFILSVSRSSWQRWAASLTIDEEDDGLVLGVILRLGNVCVQATDDFFTTFGLSVLDLALVLSVNGLG